MSNSGVEESAEDKQIISADWRQYFKYYAAVPAIIDLWGLTPAAHRLLSHYYQVVGDFHECRESLVATVTYTGLSKPTILDARRELERERLITVETKTGAGGWTAVHLTDIWQLNFWIFETLVPQLRSTDRSKLIGRNWRADLTATFRSAIDAILAKWDAEEAEEDGMKRLKFFTVTVGKFYRDGKEILPSLYIAKNIAIDLREDAPPVSVPSFSKPHAGRSRKRSVGRSRQPALAGVGDDLPDRMVAALADVMVRDPHPSMDKLAGEIIGRGISPEQIRVWYGVGGWWYREDWRGKRQETPNISTIRETLRKARESGDGNGGTAGATVVLSAGGYGS